MTKKSISRLLQASVMCCLAVLFTACEDFATEDNPTPSYISFNSKAITLNIEQTVTYKAIVAGTAVVIYSSSDETVATVDQAGKVTAVSEGTATITALVTGYDAAGKKIYTPEEKSYTVTVVDPVESLTLDQTSLSIGIGASTTIIATVNPTGYTVKWTSSDETIATVDAAGKVTGVAEGTATITAKAGGKVKTCAVTVSAGWAANEYNDASWDYVLEKVEFTKKTAASVTAVTNSDTDVTWGDGWYTVSGNVTINGKVTLSDNTSLILQDGATLTINGQLNASDKDLHIYGQMEGTGKLNVTCNDDAIKGAPGYSLGIHGGEITATATGATHRGVYFGYISIFSGKLTATAADCYAIGFNAYGFAVFGGEVEATSNATSGNYSGIQSSGPLRVYVGKVKGTGGAPSGKGFDCKLKSGTSNIKFYFSADGTTWDAGTYYASESSSPGGRYAKAE